MRKITILFLFISAVVNAGNYYVATDGSDANSGTTLSSPFQTISKACGIAVAGDHIFVRGGTYAYSSTISISKSGTEALPIILEGYSGERPLLDFSGTALGKRGFELKGNYWHMKGLDVCKAGDNGIFISGSNNTIEFCSFYENKDTGLQLGGGAHDNKMLNCDSYWNADPTDYGDADGFACKLDVGTNNYFYGCRAWLNVDDGWDGYMRGNNDVSTVLENCWTWMNGYFKDGTNGGAVANGNGFKMGGSDDKTLKHNFTLKNCVAFDNKANGFDQNSNMGSMILYNCSSFRNLGKNYYITKDLAAAKEAKVVNCLNYSGSVSLGSFVVQTTNSWMPAFTVTSEDFVSIDTTGVSSPRKADGSLPDVPFLHLAKNSDLIDAGTDVGSTYLGSAPDLGAFEFDPATGIKDLLTDKLTVYFSGENLIIDIGQQVEKQTSFRLYTLNGQVVTQAQLHSARTVRNYGNLKVECTWSGFSPETIGYSGKLSGNYFSAKYMKDSN
ncbi:MAG: right-handed parallel beta-helix repeat-containing protein [Prolixibacteraceae bacterium]